MTDASVRGVVRSTFDTLVAGQPQRIDGLRVDGQSLVVQPGWHSVVHPQDDWVDGIEDPQRVVEALRSTGVRADLLTFRQRAGVREPQHVLPFEWERRAVLPITSYEHWWNEQIKSRLRSQIRKAGKDGLEVREVPFDDDFVRGMTAIFNESPVRQGRRFWHYGKDTETVRSQFSRFVHRERMIGAYVGGQMVGFVMLAIAGGQALPTQILASLHHRDRQPSAAMIAKAVEVCAAAGASNLVYFLWGDDSLTEFKRRCGFEPLALPRYWVPLTAKGRAALRLGLHHGWHGVLPAVALNRLKQWRRAWYERRGDAAPATSQGSN